MSGPATVLREIHRLRRHAKDLHERTEHGPRQLRALQGNIARQEEALQKGQDAIKKLKVTMHDKEVSLKARQQQIKKYEDQFKTATTKKEYDALKHEIENERREISKLEDAILDVMGQTEEKAGQVPDLEKAVQQARADLARQEKEGAQQAAALAAERTKILAQLAEVEKQVPPDVREQYERLTKGRGEDALSSVVDRTCSACYTEITQQGYNELLADKFVLCKSCGRILYLPES